MGKLEGKVAVVTGGSTGIGYAAARCFKAEGAQVLIVGQDAERLATAEKTLGGRVLSIIADVRSATQLATACRTAADAHGGIDVVFANAGIALPAPIEAVTEDAYDEQMAVNVRGVFFTVQAALPHLRAGASLILNASINAHVGMPALSVYSATKAAVRSFARTMSAELAPRGIRVNAVSPGPVDTPASAKLGLPPEQLQLMLEGVRAQVPMGRIADADEIAAAVLFLACDDSSFMTGSELVVDGGRSGI